MSDPDLQRDIGRMEAEIAGLRTEVAALKTTDLAELKAEVKAVRTALDEIKGGKRALLGVAGALGGAIALAGQYLLGKHP